MKTINYTLPEFAFLDGNSHEGDSLEGRTVLQHIRSYTILEVVDLSELSVHSFTQPTYELEFMNRFGLFEKHMFVLHFSLAHEQGLPVGDAMKEIFERCADWYRDYLAWEDHNIDNEL